MGHVMQEITGDLKLLLIAVIAFLVLATIVMVVKVSRGLVNPGDHGYHKGWTKENFDQTPVAQHIEQHYEPKIKKHNKRIKRAERLERATSETSPLNALAKKIIWGNSQKLREVHSAKRQELSLTRRIFFSKQTGPRMKGNTVTHGIRRHGFGHERHSHELGGKK